MKNIPTNLSDYFKKYIELVEEDTIIEALENNRNSTVEFLSNFKTDKENYSYAPNKWTVKQVVQHIIDTERIFAYRILRAQRGDDTSLSSFNENDYAENDATCNTALADLIQEFSINRVSTRFLFQKCNEKCLDNSIRVDENEFTAKELAFIICGHTIHHMNILKERYL